MAPRDIEDTVRSGRAVTADTALRLQRTLGVRAATWLDLERRCDLDLAQSVLDLAQIKPLVTAAG